MRSFIRKAIGKLANLTPGTVYYARGWPAKINELSMEIEAQKGGKSTPLTLAAISIACAAHEYLEIGDTATIELSGVTYRDADIGHFIVTIQRVDTLKEPTR